MSIDILIIDDENDIRKLIKGILEDEGYATRQAENSSKALAEVNARVPDLMILDIWLQGSELDGLEILKHVKKDNPMLPVIMISGHGTIETAVSAIKIGAYDFIEKPFKSDRLLLMIERALETARLKKENESLKEKRDAPVKMVGASALMNGISQALEKVAGANSRVLFTGEAGTGKEVAARTLHKLSSRKDMPFMALNCAILHSDSLEEELFGIEDSKGVQQGIIERANGGTLLLDEVADMPLEIQGKIVRILQEQKFTRLKGHTPVQVDVRIVAATSRNLSDAIARGDFREDLYYRLNVVPVHIPALAQRREDIPALGQHFIELYSRQSGQPMRELSKNAVIALQDYDWPGNVRQLRNVIEWVMIMGGAVKDPIEKKDLPPEITGEAPTGESRTAAMQDYLTYPLREAREAFERDYLERQLARFGGNISKTAAYVGMERSALHRKLKTLELSNGDKGDDDSAAELKRAV
ncbi:MAG: sigma-54-dependent Fis family transcriptional regulator [Micavibrio aeruginosavorus]|uniref:Sigma-54-dependent Fis family transcriptional regulator n=1 Tax=Micavibrio aeruginosavorus TaxID=349221 RepID=A0A2W5N3E3_9BACT|nr:MAG: sigma-54-dependent Fis family transcriptional regulator [Micavibrio aeruginosavorus]